MKNALLFLCLFLLLVLAMPFSFVILLTPGQPGDFVNTESFLYLSRASLFSPPKTGLSVRYLEFCPLLCSLVAWGGGDIQNSGVQYFYSAFSC